MMCKHHPALKGLFRKLLLGGLATFLPVAVREAKAQIVTDGNAGAATALSGPAFTIPHTLGTTAGTNLFHSFSTFVIGGAQSATFTGPAGYSNVISRVTGGAPTTINGALASTIPGAAFWFVNPAGVFFGQGASVSVPASFHVSTAGHLDFANGQRFLASTAGGSTFSSAAPSAWGFSGARTGVIRVNGPSGYALTFNRPGEVSFTAGTIAVVGGAGVRVQPQNAATPTAALKMTADNLIINNASSITTFNNLAGGGEIDLTLGTLNMPNGLIGAFTVPGTASRSGNIVLSATGDVTLGGGPLSFDLDKGVFKNASQITSGATQQGGSSGDVTVSTPGKLWLRDSIIQSGVTDLAASGLVTVNAGSLVYEITGANDATRESGIESRGGGPRAGVIVNAGTIHGYGAEATIDTASFNGGRANGLNAGFIRVNANTITLTDQAGITSNAVSAGNSGQVDINVTGVFSILNGAGVSTQSDADLNLTSTAGNAGALNITADTLIVKGRAQSAYSQDAGEVAAAIASNALPGAGRAGDTSIIARSVQVLDGGAIFATAQNEFGAGNVAIAADEVIVRGVGKGPIIGGLSVEDNRLPDFPAGSALVADTTSAGAAGTIKITKRVNGPATNIFVDQGGLLMAGTSGSGAGGNIVVCCAGNFTLTGAGSGLLAGAAAGSTGTGGRISIKSDNVTFSNGAAVTVASEGSGPGGEIAVQAHQLTMAGGAAGSTQIKTLVSGAAVQQSAGQITMLAGDMIINDGSVLTTESTGPAPAGRIQIRASEMSINGGGTLFSSRSSGATTSQAGNIDIHAVNLNINDARFETLAQIGGGGNVSIGVDKKFFLNGVTMATNVNSGSATDNAGAVRWGVALPAVTIADGALCNFTCTGFNAFASKPAPNPSDGIPDFVSIINTVVDATNRGGGAGGDFVLRGDNIIQINSILDGVFNDSSSGVQGEQTVTGPEFNLPNFIIVPDRDFSSPCATQAAGERSTLSQESGGAPAHDPSAPRAELYADADVVGPQLARLSVPATCAVAQK